MSSHYPSTNTKSLILLWAFAESGIGGMLHALKLPVTGIFVGGLAVICIALIGHFAPNPRKAIREALLIVLMVKLAVSPHSPWQAYVAVVFQGYLGYLLFGNSQHFIVKCVIFTTLCMMESALQKVILSLIIYGLDFFKSLDMASKSIVASFGLQVDYSWVMVIFGLYIGIHMVLGVIIGLWIPTLPRQIHLFDAKLDGLTFNPEKFSKKRSQNIWKSLVLSTLGIIFVLYLIKWWVPSFTFVQVAFIFLRSIILSLIMIFFVGPWIVRRIQQYANKQEFNKSLLLEILDEIPLFSNKAFGLVRWINAHYNGLAKVKYMILGLLAIAMYPSKTYE
ncbi:MAG: hypothetical protein WBO36_14025 [Saprospiraceae bacterium]